MSTHGADLEKIKREYKVGGELIDFSSNINPYMPECVGKCIKKSINKINIYPDIEYVKVREKISSFINRDYNLDYEFSKYNIIVGNGATELIFLFSRIFIDKKIGVFEPTFSEYKRAIDLSKNQYMSIDIALIDCKDVIDEKNDIPSDVDVIFLCNPNNPDGRLRNLEKIIEKCIEKDISIVVDETFIEFCEDYRERTALQFDYKKIFVLRAITKFYGMPGVRFGYMISRDIETIDKMWSEKEPWTVNSIAEEVAINVFDDKKFAEFTRYFYKVERKFLLDELRKIDGIHPFESDSAFILIKFDGEPVKNANGLKDFLILNESIIIRNASNFNGLDENYFRIAIKKREDNIRIVDGIRKFMEL